MFRRVRPTNPLGWGIATCYLIAMLLLIWAVALVDWWSTATSLVSPRPDSGSSLLVGYPWLAVAMAILIPAGWFLSSSIRNARGLVGFAGVALTLLATQLDSPVEGLVSTNAWIPASIAWLIYFGAQLAALSTRAPQLEFQPGPDSSDG